MRLYFSLVILNACIQIIMPQSLWAQEFDESRDCTEPTEIAINSGGISLVSSGEYESYGAGDKPIIFYKPSDKYTFWYKFIVQESCSFSFNIFPSSPTDIYNFFLYKHPGGSFCKGIIDRSIIPIRANLYRRAIHTTGTGLKKNVDASKSASGKSTGEQLYNQSYHQIVDAEAGDIYYLNVYHTAGDDCGHRINISACSKNLEIVATHKPCFIPPVTSEDPEESLQFTEPLSVLEIETFDYEAEIEIYEPAVMEASITHVQEFLIPAKPALHKSEIKEVRLSIVEGNSNKGLRSDIKVIDQETGHTIRYQIDADDDETRIQLDRTRNYKVVFSSLGYINQTIEIEAAQNYSKDIHIKMAHVKAGTNLVLKDLYFHPNTFAVRDESYVEVESLLNFMQMNTTAKIKLIGYTSGDYHIKNSKRYKHLGPKWNYRGTSKKLSKLRAAEIREYLSKHGIDQDRIEIEGRGGENMIIAHPLSNRENLVNMRVEMLILEI